MSSLAYYLVSLATALLVIAVASALIAGRLRRGQRRVQAVRLIAALARHGEWAATQGRAIRFQAAVEQRDAAVEEIRRAQSQWFPELAESIARLLAIDDRMAQLLSTHERLRAQDPEASLECGCDAAFLGLWREQSAVLDELERRLAAIATRADGPEYTFTA